MRLGRALDEGALVIAALLSVYLVQIVTVGDRDAALERDVRAYELGAG